MTDRVLPCQQPGGSVARDVMLHTASSVLVAREAPPLT